MLKMERFQLEIVKLPTELKDTLDCYFLFLFFLHHFKNCTLCPCVSAAMTEGRPSSARWAWVDSSLGWIAACRACVSTSAGGSPSRLTWPTAASAQVRVNTRPPPVRCHSWPALLHFLFLLSVFSLRGRRRDPSRRHPGLRRPPAGRLERRGPGGDPHRLQTAELQPHDGAVGLHPLPLQRHPALRRGL